MLSRKVAPKTTVSLTGVWLLMETPAGSGKARAVAKTVLVAAETVVGAGMLTDQAPLAKVADS